MPTVQLELARTRCRSVCALQRFHGLKEMATRKDGEFELLNTKQWVIIFCPLSVVLPHLTLLPDASFKMLPDRRW
jgi:hypothetical protein